jgi:NAD(P)-dependent dehydrogenase (short-subunit alcohol dehydrogenase family)
MMQSQRLKQKIALIIGAGQQPGQTLGNGRATAERFAQEGAILFLVDINADWLNETVEAIRAAGGQVESLVADITKESECSKIVAECFKKYGRIDILHNNVGLSKGDKKTPELDVSSWEYIMDRNLKGMFMMCKHTLPIMIEQKSGCIINISSTASMAARPTITYKTSKAGVNALTQHIAIENAPFGIRANAVLPGLMDTPMAINRRAEERGVSPDLIRQERNALVPLKRMGSAWDVANAAVFLASDEAAYITGVLLPVDGGLLQKRG